MAISETAKLIASLTLDDKLSPGVSSAIGSVNRLEASLAKTGSRAIKTGQQIGTGVGKAGSHFKNLLTGPLGIIGLTGGLFSLGGAFESSVRHASEMGFAVEKLTGLTGSSATSMSQLLVVFEKFGIDADRTSQIVGFAEKTLGKLAVGVGSAKDGVSKLTKLEALYGINLHDNTGKAVDFATELNRVADFYNSNATAGNKAAVAATLFGRGYAAMIPILKLGSKGIKEAEASAAALGLTLTAANAVDLKNYRGALRDVGEAIGGLQLQIGLALLPEVAKLAKGLTGFLEHGGTQKIVGFFKDAAHFAEDLGGVIANDVIPTVSGLAGAASKFWNGIPAPLRDLLFKGFVADRTISFLFGVSPIKLIAAPIVEAVGGALVKSLFQRGGTPATPLFVSDVTGGLGKGVGALAGGAAEAAGGGIAATVAAIAAPIFATAAVGAAAVIINNGIQDQARGLGDQTAAFTKTATDQQLSDAINGLQKTVDELGPLNPFNQKGIAVEQLNALIAAQNSRTLNAQGDTHSENVRIAGAIADGFKTADTRSEAIHTAEANVAATKALAPKLDALRTAFVRDFAALRKATKPVDIQAFAKKVGGEIAKGVGSLKTTDKVLASLKAQLAKAHDSKTAAVLRAAIEKVERRLPGREAAAKANSTLAKMLSDGKLTKAELVKIKAVETALKDRGLPHAASEIGKKVDAAKARIAAATAATTAAAKGTTAAIKNQKLAVTFAPNVNISIRDVTKGYAIGNRYTTTFAI